MLLTTQGSEFSESLQELKNFQVFVRVRPVRNDEILQSRRSPDRCKLGQPNGTNFSQQTYQLSNSTRGSSSSSPIPNKNQQQPFGTSFSTQILSQQFPQLQQQQTQQFGGVAQLSGQSVFKVNEENGILTVSGPDFRSIEGREKSYQFDGVLGETSSNVQTFNRAVLPSLAGILEGYNATVFAYGITGSGKTHTIFGGNGGLQKSSNINYDFDIGVCQMAVEYLLGNLEMRRTTIKFSFLEIYNETVRDLLNPSLVGGNKNLTIFEDPVSKNISVMDLKEYAITDIKELINEGNERRALAATTANQFSSRSHAIIILHVSQRQIDPITGIEEVITSKLTIIDLAGSEKSDKIGTQGKGVQEGSNINKSLLALGNCINILAEKKRVGMHVPYRDSKLTRILKDTLGGNTKSVMIACVSSNASCLDETINTLNYASRATNIKKRVSRNVVQELDYLQQKQLIRDLQTELCFYKNRDLGVGGDACQQQYLSTRTSRDQWVKLSAVQTEEKLKEEQRTLMSEISEIKEKLRTSSASSIILRGSKMESEINGSQEQFLERICSDLFQNVEESHQLASSLSEIEQLLKGDYQQLAILQQSQGKSSFYNQQVAISELAESIHENEEIREKMRIVLQTNQEQKVNLKFLLLKLASKSSMHLDYELKIRKQQLEMLSILESKLDLEKQVEILKQQLSEMTSSGGQQQNVSSTQYPFRTQTCPDEASNNVKNSQEIDENTRNGNYSSINISNNSLKSSKKSKQNSGQAFTEQLLKQQHQSVSSSSMLNQHQQQQQQYQFQQPYQVSQQQQYHYQSSQREQQLTQSQQPLIQQNFKSQQDISKYQSSPTSLTTPIPANIEQDNMRFQQTFSQSILQSQQQQPHQTSVSPLKNSLMLEKQKNNQLLCTSQQNVAGQQAIGVAGHPKGIHSSGRIQTTTTTATPGDNINNIVQIDPLKMLSNQRIAVPQTFGSYGGVSSYHQQQTQSQLQSSLLITAPEARTKELSKIMTNSENIGVLFNITNDILTENTPYNSSMNLPISQSYLQASIRSFTPNALIPMQLSQEKLTQQKTNGIYNQNKNMQADKENKQILPYHYQSQSQQACKQQAQQLPNTTAGSLLSSEQKFSLNGNQCEKQQQMHENNSNNNTKPSFFLPNSVPSCGSSSTQIKRDLQSTVTINLFNNNASNQLSTNVPTAKNSIATKTVIFEQTQKPIELQHTQVLNPQQPYESSTQLNGITGKLLNYGALHLEEDCEPKLESRRSSELLGDSAAKINPLETEESSRSVRSSQDQDEQAKEKQSYCFVSSPQFNKTSRTLGIQKPNLYKKQKINLELLE